MRRYPVLKRKSQQHLLTNSCGGKVTCIALSCPVSKVLYDESDMNNNDDVFSFNGRIRSVKHAIDGVIEILKGQHNAWLHFIATICVVVAALFFQVTKIEWCILVLAIVSVWVAEALNTAFEFLCDVASPEFHPLVKKSKDVAAGAVLLSAIGAVIIGLIVFIPYVTKSV